MRFLTKAESIQTLQGMDPSTAGSGADQGSAELWVNIEGCLSRSAAASRLFVRLFGIGQPAFLWINEFGIWPSLENRHLFDSLRKTSGEAQPLYQSPGHMFAADEQDALVSYLQLVIVFGWGGVLVDLENCQRLIISHDSWASIRVQSEMPFLMKAVEDFGLPHQVAELPRNTLAALGLSRDGEILNPQSPLDV